ncbi:MAG: hypothetical protein PVSMB1_08170 [Gemmatimonadaceae bacterium]
MLARPSLVAAILFLLSSPAPAQQTIAVPSGIVIPVVLSQPISSKNARAGQTFAFRTTADTRIENLDVPADTPGSGVIVRAHAAGGTKGAELELQPQALHLASGAIVAITLAPSNRNAAAKRSRSHIFPFPIIMWGTPFIGAFLSPARDVTMPAGTRFEVVTQQQ